MHAWDRSQLKQTTEIIQQSYITQILFSTKYRKLLHAVLHLMCGIIYIWVYSIDSTLFVFTCYFYCTDLSLVWGLLRLAPITKYLALYKYDRMLKTSSKHLSQAIGIPQVNFLSGNWL